MVFVYEMQTGEDEHDYVEFFFEVSDTVVREEIKELLVNEVVDEARLNLDENEKKRLATVLSGMASMMDIDDALRDYYREDLKAKFIDKAWRRYNDLRR